MTAVPIHRQAQNLFTLMIWPRSQRADPEQMCSLRSDAESFTTGQRLSAHGGMQMAD